MYGFSYHPDREAAHRLHMDNEFNPGLGLHYELVNDLQGITFYELGIYYDSGQNWAKFAALGHQFKFGERWRIGAAVALLDSPTYNEGIAIVTMIPLITYDMGLIKVNVAYFPKFGRYSKVEAFGFYVGFPLGRWAE